MARKFESSTFSCLFSPCSRVYARLYNRALKNESYA